MLQEVCVGLGCRICGEEEEEEARQRLMGETAPASLACLSCAYWGVVVGGGDGGGGGGRRRRRREEGGGGGGEVDAEDSSSPWAWGRGEGGVEGLLQLQTGSGFGW